MILVFLSLKPLTSHIFFSGLVASWVELMTRAMRPPLGLT